MGHGRGLDSMIKAAGWFDGTADEWEAIPFETRQEMAFKATGCLIAYATWTAPVNCLHTECRLRRGEITLRQAAESVIDGERSSGYLRTTSEKAFAILRKGLADACEKANVSDPWDLPGGWVVFVRAGLTA